MWLHTEHGNSEARALYDALGYTVAKVCSAAASAASSAAELLPACRWTLGGLARSGACCTPGLCAWRAQARPAAQQPAPALARSSWVMPAAVEVPSYGE